MLAYRHIQEEDFINIEKWLKFWHKDKVFVRKMYPNTGLIIYDKETNTDLYAGFVWLSNSGIAQIGFITRNPFTKFRNKQTLKLLNEGLLLYAKELGYDYVMTWVESESLKSNYRELGMIELSSNVSEFIIKLN